MIITYDMLVKEKACSYELAKFALFFDKVGEVTLEKCLSVSHLFNWNWAATAFLSDAVVILYEKILAPARLLRDTECEPAAEIYYDSVEKCREKYRKDLKVF
jgi:hypothetical protein